MRITGLEPARPGTQEPKSCASANSAISARQHKLRFLHLPLRVRCVPLRYASSFPQNCVLREPHLSGSVITERVPTEPSHMLNNNKYLTQNQ